jgi:hypothetical protein
LNEKYELGNEKSERETEMEYMALTYKLGNGSKIFVNTPVLESVSVPT